MEHIAFNLPEQRNYEYSYGLAYKLACEQLAKVENLEELCRRAGCSFYTTDSKKVVTLTYLNHSYQVALPDVAITRDSGGEVPLRDKIIILHYLIMAKETSLTHKVMTYKELKEGAAYFPTFQKRAIKPLVDCFGKFPERLQEAAKALGARKAEYGDVAVTIDAFSRVPITIVLFKGDDEFPADGNILFDSTISDYLSTEDIVILCQTIAWGLVKGSC